MYTRVHISRFPPSFAGKTSTVLQAVTLAATIAANAFLPQVLPFVQVLFRVSLFMTLYSAWGYMRRASKLVEAQLAPSA
jgi:Fe2+ transport system protein B